MLKVCDNKGACATSSATVNITNLAPTVAAISAPIDPVEVNSPIIAGASFTDPGVPDNHTAVWDWGDGNTSPDTVTEANGSGSVTESHTYTAAGVYTVKLTVTDDDGDAGHSTFQYIVVYDTSAGFVTGQGFITSPPGAYVPNPSLTGLAQFAFTSKYQPGATAPTGTTVFRFRTADVDFHSTSYQWLVVAGARGQFKGTGRLNGIDGYGFILTAIDGQQPGGGGEDKFRIKITDSNGNVVDNQMSSPDDGDQWECHQDPAGTLAGDPTARVANASSICEPGWEIRSLTAS